MTIAPEPSAFGKALGVHWDTTTDSLYISIPTVNLQHPTKRYITSSAAKIFDVMGWISLVTLSIKMLLQ